MRNGNYNEIIQTLESSVHNIATHCSDMRNTIKGLERSFAAVNVGVTTQQQQRSEVSPTGLRSWSYPRQDADGTQVGSGGLSYQRREPDDSGPQRSEVQMSSTLLHLLMIHQVKEVHFLILAGLNLPPETEMTIEGLEM